MTSEERDKDLEEERTSGAGERRFGRRWCGESRFGIKKQRAGNELFDKNDRKPPIITSADEIETG